VGCGLGINDGGLMMGAHGRKGGLILWLSRHGVGGGLGCPMVGMDLGISGGCGYQRWLPGIF
jgi:hypothetical protein